MAVLAGLIVGVIGALRGWRLRSCLVPPLLFAALEIVVNTQRFGVGAMVVWTPILIVLTVGATAGALALARALKLRRARASTSEPGGDQAPPRQASTRP